MQFSPSHCTEHIPETVTLLPIGRYSIHSSHTLPFLSASICLTSLRPIPNVNFLVLPVSCSLGTRTVLCIRLPLGLIKQRLPLPLSSLKNTKTEMSLLFPRNWQPCFVLANCSCLHGKHLTSREYSFTTLRRYLCRPSCPQSQDRPTYLSEAIRFLSLSSQNHTSS